MIESKQKVLIVEGNIGAGKSTFLKMLDTYLDVQVVYEPDKKWQNVADGESLLDKFYTDTKRWAYTFQTYAFVTRVVEQKMSAEKNPTTPQVIERSVYADRYCFAQNCYEMGLMSALEWKLYQEWFSWLVDNYTVKPTGFIYLRAEPEICYERIAKRSRAAEKGVSFDYIKMLHQKHEEWLIDRKNLSPVLHDIPVLTLPCDTEFENNPAEQEKHVAQIKKFFDIQTRMSIPKDNLNSLTL
jgi:deoxyadenosine/deoxycytidine kinase